MELTRMENYTGATLDSLIARIEWLKHYILNIDELIRRKCQYLEYENSKYYINRPIFKDVFKLKPSSIMGIKDRQLMGLIRQVQSMEILIENKMFHYKRIETYIDKIYKGGNNG